MHDEEPFKWLKGLLYANKRALMTSLHLQHGNCLVTTDISRPVAPTNAQLIFICFGRKTAQIPSVTIWEYDRRHNPALLLCIFICLCVCVYTHIRLLVTDLAVYICKMNKGLTNICREILNRRIMNISPYQNQYWNDYSTKLDSNWDPKSESPSINDVLHDAFLTPIPPT